MISGYSGRWAVGGQGAPSPSGTDWRFPETRGRRRLPARLLRALEWFHLHPGPGTSHSRDDECPRPWSARPLPPHQHQPRFQSASFHSSHRASVNALKIVKIAARVPGLHLSRPLWPPPVSASRPGMLSPGLREELVRTGKRQEINAPASGPHQH